MSTSTNDEIRSFRIEIPQPDLDDLQERLRRTRFANELPDVDTGRPQVGPVPPGWEYGVPLSYVRRLVERWRDGYDWREWEAKLNAHPQFVTEIDGQDIHFLHVRSPEPDAVPLILTHGWPNTVVEYLDLVGPLTDPRAHGGDPADAFHVVVPSIPGFGFSGPTTQKGWNRYRIARAWSELARRLGYERYGVHGNDAGSNISPEVARLDPDHVIGVHVTQIFSFPSGDPAEFEGLTPQDMDTLQFLQRFNDEMSAFAQLQGTKPQNLAHALADSPAGQLAWIGQLLGEAVEPDVVLTNATIYWLTNTGASSARLYYEDRNAEHPTEPTTAPTGLRAVARLSWPCRHSGAMKPTTPETVAVSRPSAGRVDPKSMSTACPDSSTTTLPGCRSRCMRSRPWRAARPAARSRTRSKVAAGSSGTSSRSPSPSTHAVAT